MPEEIGIEQARKTLGAVINRAEDGVTTIITRNGRAVAAITPMEVAMPKLWIVETNASMARANVLASEIFGLDVKFSQGGRLGIELASYDHDKLAATRDALRAAGSQAAISTHR